MKRTKEKSEATLFEVSSLLRQGKLTSLPSRILLDLENTTKDQYWALLELLRYQSFGGALLERQHRLHNVVQLRNLINSGRLAEAHQLLPQNDLSEPELVMEQVRIFIFSGKFSEAADLALRGLKMTNMELCTRGVLSQLCGHALLELHNADAAHAYFESALDIAHSIGNTNGKVSCWLFLAKFAAFEGQLQKTRTFLDLALEQITDENLNLRWLLGFYRTLAQIESISPERLDSKVLEFYFTSAHLATLLGDHLYANRCRIEAALVLSHDWSSDEIAEIIDGAFKKNSDVGADLPQWLEALRTRRIVKEASFTLDRLFSASTMPGVFSAQEFLEKMRAFENASWIYDNLRGILVNSNEKSFSSIPKDAPIGRILTILSEHVDHKMSQETLFEAVWRIRWNADRHLNTLKVAISRFNQKSNDLKIVRVDDFVGINLKGIVF